jgi:hypothetical protein
MASDLSNSFMRTVSFVERIEVEFHGNVISQAMVLADVDNDMTNELVVGNIDGLVAIFKGISPHPWRKITVSGMLTCLAVGEVHIPRKNSLVCMTAEGWCCIYDVSSHKSTQSMGTADDETESGYIKPFFTQELPANARVMCLADIDSDGHVEMVIGYSDRVVRAFRWHETPDSDSGHFLLIQRWQLAGQIGSITINYNHDHQPELMVSQPGATFVSLQVRPAFRHNKSESYLDKMSDNNKSDHGIERSGSFATSGRNDTSTASYMQNLPGQANLSKSEIFSSKSDTISYISDISNRSAENISMKSVDKNESKPHRPETLKSTDGQSNKSEAICRGAKLDSSPDKISEALTKLARRLSLERIDSAHVAKFTGSPKDFSDGALDKSLGRLNSTIDTFDIIYHPLAHMQTRNKDTSTLIIGGINRRRPSYVTSSGSQPQPTYYALATLDGSLILVENDTIIWSLQVDHYLFALAKLDVTGNGKEEVVCCSWNGQTYIVNHSKEIVRYHFPDSVAAFCAGYFSVRDRSNTPCFVYATFNNRIYIYPNITLPRVESTNLIKVLGKKKETRDLLHKLNVNVDDVESLQSLYRWCLYGWPREPV